MVNTLDIQVEGLSQVSAELCCFLRQDILLHMYLSLFTQVLYTYFKKGCFSDACFIDRSASCLLNLLLPFSRSYRTCSPKTRANVYFMIWFSPGVHLVRKTINEFIYSKHDALRSMKQGSCITHH